MFCLGSLTYQIRGVDPLTLRPTGGDSESAQLELKLSDKFNYIRGDVQQAIVEVADSPDVPHSTQLSVKIRIDEQCQQRAAFTKPVCQ